MYKITELRKDFDKPLMLVWMRAIESRGDAPTVVRGFANPGSLVRDRTESFGGIKYALNFLNKTDCKPDYVSVNGIQSPLAGWFDRV